MVGVLGFSFSGQGQNAALAFVTLKDWAERSAPGSSAQDVAGRAFGALMGIRDAFIFPLSPPPIPELGTVRANTPPIVVITSNRTREIHDAIKRRCLYYWVDYPSLERELAIVRRKLPAVDERLSLQIVKFIQRLRREDLFKRPGIAEAIDWTRALTALDVLELSPQNINDTMGVLLKYQDDIARLRTRIDTVLTDATS